MRARGVRSCGTCPPRATSRPPWARWAAYSRASVTPATNTSSSPTMTCATMPTRWAAWRRRSRARRSCVRRTISILSPGMRGGTPDARYSIALPVATGQAHWACTAPSWSAPADTTAARCSRTSSWCAPSSRREDMRRCCSTRSSSDARRRRDTSGRSASARRTTSWRGRRASRGSSRSSPPACWSHGVSAGAVSPSPYHGHLRR